ncbi:MAG: hypothetical protein AAF311_11290 [Pseudomonadota bacterium]
MSNDNAAPAEAESIEDFALRYAVQSMTIWGQKGAPIEALAHSMVGLGTATLHGRLGAEVALEALDDSREAILELSTARERPVN